MGTDYLRTLLGLGVLVSILVAGPGLGPVGAGARNPCAEPGNLTVNCGFDTFTEQSWNGKQLRVPEGWWFFVLEGSPDFRQGADTFWGQPALWLVTDGVPFTAGIYQQVSVTPGVVYQTDIGWAAARCGEEVCQNMERRLGLDPTGGTNPLAPSVVWSRIEAGGDKWPDLTVSARATGPRMTVFVWVNHPASYGPDEVYLDAVGLWPDLSQPAATATPKPSPTPTRRPPTPTPKPRPATATPTEPPTAVPADTETPTPEPTATATDTPTPEPTATWTVTPSPLPPTDTPTPTLIPTRTPLPVARVVSTPAVRSVAHQERTTVQRASSARVLLYIGAGALAGAVLLAGLALWLWLHGRKVAGEQ